MDWMQVLTIVGSLAGFAAWIISRIDKKFEEGNKKFDELKTEIKDIRIEIKEIRTSLNRIEGAFYAKECCMLKEEKQNRKAE